MLMQWYELLDPERIDTPALLVFRERVAYNIEQMLQIAGDASRLVPHVKTHKMQEVVEMQLEKGIRRFKCATIAEAEMIGMAVNHFGLARLNGTVGVLLAYQLNLPKVDRYIHLIKAFPKIEWASLVDNVASANLLQSQAQKAGLTVSVYVDIDAGMHRTGIEPEKAEALAQYIHGLPNLLLAGLHAYDGHIRDSDFEERRARVEAGFKPVHDLEDRLKADGFSDLELIAGGTPSFTVHALHKDYLYSPGTCLLWDEGYGRQLPEQPFVPAAVLMTRVVSRPGPGLITTDLGHKAVSAENPVDKRVFFLNLKDYQVVSQSEEHLVVQVPPGTEPPVGTILYAIPYHVCPSVALHEEAQVVEGGHVTAVWPVVARRRRINI
jgi:D-serine deaminase-like pyridoxal phosphate-dependent protein